MHPHLSRSFVFGQSTNRHLLFPGCRTLLWLCWLWLFTGTALAQSERCDDGNPCTSDEFIRGLGCVHFSIEGCQICQQNSDCADPDENLCTGTYYCDTSGGTGLCKLNPGSVITCPISNASCEMYQCQPDTGACVLTPKSDAVSCDDGLPCTTNDHCQSGACVGGQNICSCQSDEDCEDDGNLCNGTSYCDKSSFPYLCATNPATVISCSTSNDTACQKSLCNATTGSCEMTHVAGACNDNNPCTTQDACVAGECVGELSIGIDGICQCATDTDCAAFEDGNLCNGTLFCNLATNTCKLNPATIITCPSVNDTTCRQNACDATTGQCKLISQDSVCDDGDPCTVEDACIDGQCRGQESIGQDGVCECEVDADCAILEDGDLCNGTLYCDRSLRTCVLNPSTVIEPGVSCMTEADCPSGFGCIGSLSTDGENGQAIRRMGHCSLCPSAANTECQISKCDPQTGMCNAEIDTDGTSCSGDGNPCTVGDSCQSGTCGGTLDVGAGATCECQNNADCHDDGDLCNGTLYCDLATHRCQTNPATVVTCPHDNDESCRAQRCQPNTGQCIWENFPAGETCDDQDPCTAGDQCQAGQCGGQNICECRTDADCSDDGNLCNGTPYCDRSAPPWRCKTNPATIVRCADENPDDCTLRVCVPGTGLCEQSPADEGAACTDGLLCTKNDRCVGGVCTGDAVCSVNARCVVSVDGSTDCECAAGYTGADCETQVQLPTCEENAVRCEGALLKICRATTANDSSSVLETFDCHAFPVADDLTQAGSCIAQPETGAACVFQLGQMCSFGDRVVDVACGDDSGIVETMACDAEQGCIENLGSCEPHAFAATCQGTRRIFACSAWGQKQTLDCTSPSLGARACEGAGVCVGVPEGLPCLGGVLECDEGLLCEGQDNHGIGLCTRPAVSPPSACVAPAEWLADGFCDAVANVASCEWDRGDCCAASCIDSAYPCGVVGYDCRDPAMRLITDAGSPDEAEDGGIAHDSADGGPATCTAPPEWLGDGYCDPSANEELCEWDRGDCCPSTCNSTTYLCGSVPFDCLDPNAPLWTLDGGIFQDASVEPTDGSTGGEGAGDAGTSGTDAAQPLLDAGHQDFSDAATGEVPPGDGGMPGASTADAGQAAEVPAEQGGSADDVPNPTPTLEFVGCKCVALTERPTVGFFLTGTGLFFYLRRRRLV